MIEVNTFALFSTIVYYKCEFSGFVCPRHEIRANGCCNDGITSVIQYSCETCETNNCCAIYEYCISCCLHPDKVSYCCTKYLNFYKIFILLASLNVKCLLMLYKFYWLSKKKKNVYLHAWCGTFSSHSMWQC